MNLRSRVAVVALTSTAVMLAGSAGVAQAKPDHSGHAAKQHAASTQMLGQEISTHEH